MLHCWGIQPPYLVRLTIALAAAQALPSEMAQSIAQQRIAAVMARTDPTLRLATENAIEDAKRMAGR